MDELNRLRPLDPGDPDFQSAVDAMKQALSHPMVNGPGPQFWFVDRGGSEAVDMVSVVDVPTFGNIARGSGDWATYSAGLSLLPLSDRHAVTDVLEAIVGRLRAVRKETKAPPGP